MKRHILVAIFIVFIVPTPSFGSCEKWLTGSNAGGYCTDYIQSVTGGYRQRGNAGSWDVNIDKSEVQSGDVAIFHIGLFGHVAYVENVNRNSIGAPISVDISEYNWGTYDGKTAEEKSCAVTNNYNVITTRSGIPLSDVYGFWRPGGYSGSGALCASLNSRYSICWKTDSDASCRGGKDWELYDFDTASIIRIDNNSYCPDLAGAGGYSESSGQPPVTGGTNSGALPNLISNNSDIENGSKVKVTTLHIEEKGYCRMQAKNVGSKDAGAFQTRCYISDGYKIDSNPRDEGKEDTKGLAKGKTHTEHEDFFASEYPGTYNAVFCVDSAKQVTESNEGDNCHAEDIFTVWSNPNLGTVDISLGGGRTILQPSEAFSIDATIINTGENFGRTILVGYYIDNVLIGTDHIRRENLKGGMSKMETLSQAFAPSVPGVHAIQVCSDYDNRIVETNESDNCLVKTVEVKDPNPPVSEDPVPCPVITPATWSTWQGLGYSEPFDTVGNILITPFCRESQPNDLSITLGKYGDPNTWVYKTLYVRDKTTGADTPYTLHCNSVESGDWCQSLASTAAKNTGIDTSSSSNPTLILGYVCKVVNGSWQCPFNWQIQGAGM